MVLDDTCYFVPCQTQAEAELLATMLNSEPAREFYSAFLFWDAKRPITVELLRRLDLQKLAVELGCVDEFTLLSSVKGAPGAKGNTGLLWRE